MTADNQRAEGTIFSRFKFILLLHHAMGTQSSADYFNNPPGNHAGRIRATTPRSGLECRVGITAREPLAADIRVKGHVEGLAVLRQIGNRDAGSELLPGIEVATAGCGSYRQPVISRCQIGKISSL